MLHINPIAVSISILMCSLCMVRAQIPDRKSLMHFYGAKRNPSPDVTIHKVTLTQKGYIQFLRYMTEVPTINDFTFCIWLKSENLTHSHPLLSYSKHEKERFIRAWITPHGKNFNLEILENKIFSVPLNLMEDRWYHLCQSWESRSGSWNVFMNGKIKAGGVNVKANGRKIPSGGDIVVGQEYTDFDKGLDDGIEGDIFGFNLVLAAASSSEKQSSNYLKQNDLAQRRRQLNVPATYALKTSMNIHNPEGQQQEGYFDYHTTGLAGGPASPQEDRSASATDVPEPLSYFAVGANRDPKGLLDFGRSFLNMFSFFEPARTVRVRAVDAYSHENGKRYFAYYDARPIRNVHPVKTFNPNKGPFGTNSRILNEVGLNYKPLGLVLVELSYQNCALGKGSPVNDKRLLISWTKTPVRVFGGAILTTIAPFCLETF